jgi:hypothetical protein
MAYLREIKQELEVDFSLVSVWEAIPKAVDELDWEIQEKDETTHHLTVNVPGNLTSYESMIKIQLSKLNDKTTLVAIFGETPVTTITFTLDFSQTNECIDDFALTLAKIMNS